MVHGCTVTKHAVSSKTCTVRQAQYPTGFRVRTARQTAILFHKSTMAGVYLLQSTDRHSTREGPGGGKRTQQRVLAVAALHTNTIRTRHSVQHRVDVYT